MICGGLADASGVTAPRTDARENLRLTTAISSPHRLLPADHHQATSRSFLKSLLLQLGRQSAQTEWMSSSNALHQEFSTMAEPYRFARTDAARKLPAHLQNRVDDITCKISDVIMYLAKKRNVDFCFKDLLLATNE